jgi:glycine/D-amino acid oxidase-like deaminating enzyme
MAKRAFALWRQYDERWQRGFLHRIGAMWFFGAGTAAIDFERASVDALRAEELPFEHLTPVEARRRFPQVNFDGVASVVIEHEAGYLLARRSCEHVVDRAAAEGAEYRQAAAKTPIRIDRASMQSVLLTDGTTLRADAFVFACGPWLGAMFPDVVGTRVTPTRQEVYYFGTPAGDARFLEAQLPVWVDYGQRLVYGIPGNANRGFKVADDTAGPRFDPTNGRREATAAGVARARAFIARRFPDLAAAPLVGTEVCQYEASPDSNYVIDRHPGASNVWIVGGGSGHGFKMGPAIGEIVASLVLGESQPDPFFGFARFAHAKDSEKGNQRKWI